MAQLLARLEGGPLAAVPLERCDGADVALESRPEGLVVRLRRGEREASHEVPDVAAAALWLESWMMPVEPAAASMESEEEPEEPESVPPTEPALASNVEPSPASPVALHFAGAASVEGSAVAGTALGGEIWTSVRVSPRFALGFALAGQAGIGRSAVRRSALLATIRAEGLVPLGGARMHLGGGVGLVSSTASQDLAGGANEHQEAGPVLEGTSTVVIPFRRGVALDLGVRARVYLTNVGNGDQQSGDDADDVELRPLPRASIVATVGLAWEREGFL